MKSTNELDNIILTSDMVCFQTELQTRFSLGLSFEAFIEMPSGEEIGTWISCADFFGFLAENGEEEISPDEWEAHLNSGRMDNAFIADYLNDRDGAKDEPTPGELEIHYQMEAEASRGMYERANDIM